MRKEARDQGSYLLILSLRRDRSIDVGSLGRISFKKGFYIYVGSAMAYLSKRIERHRHIRKRHHWHIDKLRAQAEIHAVLDVHSSTRLECKIAKDISKISEWIISGFGSSDCSCGTHLFGMKKDPLLSDNFHKLFQYFRMNRYEEKCFGED